MGMAGRIYTLVCTSFDESGCGTRLYRRHFSRNHSSISRSRTRPPEEGRMGHFKRSKRQLCHRLGACLQGLQTFLRPEVHHDLHGRFAGTRTPALGKGHKATTTVSTNHTAAMSCKIMAGWPASSGRPEIFDRRTEADWTEFIRISWMIAASPVSQVWHS